ncbi:MAG: GNAT family N-acetyltransferase [Planctomycetota bacterium]|jgi:hypothetical protein
MAAWQQVDAPTLSAIQERTAEILRNTPATEMEHDLRWIEGVAKAPSKSVAVYVFRREETVAGYAPFLIHPATLSYELGGTTLLKRRISRYALIGGPVLEKTSEDDVADLFRALRPQLKVDNVVFLGAVSADSSLARLLRRRSPLRKDYHVLPYGPAYQRRRIRFDGMDYEAYLQSLRKTTRRDLKRSQRKFLAKAGDSFTVKRFETREESELFLQHATEISKKTYQWHLLGLGMRDQEDRGTNFGHAAEQGWLRSYVLYVDDTPIAFQAGYLHRRIYYAHNTGYDPEWREAHAGRFLLAELIRDLLADAEPVEVFDFLWGDDLLKARLANSDRTERHYYLFPRGFHGALLYYPLRGVALLSAAASAVLDRLRLKTYARRLIRRRSVK